MKTIKYLLLAFFLPLVASCGSFGEGMLAGLANMGGYGFCGNGYMASFSHVSSPSGYFLIPNSLPFHFRLTTIKHLVREP